MQKGTAPTAQNKLLFEQIQQLFPEEEVVVFPDEDEVVEPDELIGIQLPSINEPDEKHFGTAEPIDAMQTLL